MTLAEATRAEEQLADAQRDRIGHVAGAAGSVEHERCCAGAAAAVAPARAPLSPWRRASAACHASTSSRFRLTFAATPVAGSGSASIGSSGVGSTARSPIARASPTRTAPRTTRAASPLTSRTKCACSAPPRSTCNASRNVAAPSAGIGAPSSGPVRTRSASGVAAGLASGAGSSIAETDEVAGDVDLRPAGDEGERRPIARLPRRRPAPGGRSCRARAPAAAPRR